MIYSNDDIDAAILSAAGDDWAKVAVVISRVFDAPAAADIPQDKRGQVIAERLYILVDNGALACQGNMRRWRDSSVKLPNTARGAAAGRGAA